MKRHKRTKGCAQDSKFSFEVRRPVCVLMISVMLLFSGPAISNEQKVTIISPSGEIFFDLSVEQSQLHYAVRRNERSIIGPSRLGLVFKGNENLSLGLTINRIQRSAFDQTWQTVWGENLWIRNHYNEMVVSMSNPFGDLDLIVRAFDDGIAFRYHVRALQNQHNAIVSDEITEFAVGPDAQAWWIEAYHPNRYEQHYQSTAVSDISVAHTPLTMRLMDGTHISIHEANLDKYSSMQLKSDNEGGLEADLAPWHNGDKVRVEVPFLTPWRTVKVANTAAELKSSSMTLNLNPPNKLTDVSWIKPAKYIGIWWGMILGKWTWKESFRHGATTERALKYIDFAAEHGFDEVLVEGTSAGFTALFPGEKVDTSFTKTTSDFDLNFVQNHAKSRGVSLQAYHETSANTENYLQQIDDAFAQMQQLGIRTAKIGHVGNLLNHREWHYGQFAVEYFRTVLEKAAQYSIAVNFHEPIKDTGERRTFPNMLTREGAKGMEYNAWGVGNPPEHETILAFTRLLEAPMDFTPGIMDLTYEKVDDSNGPEFPVDLTVIDKGNGFSSIRYKGAESLWRPQPMTREIEHIGSDAQYVWKTTVHMQPGEWEWGAIAGDVVSKDPDFWLLSLLNMPNLVVKVGEDGEIGGQTSMVIPDQKFASKINWSSERASSTVSPRVNTTLAKQLALYVTIYSPLQMAADFIENYADQAAFKFIKDVPVDWKESLVLNGEIGQYVTIARKDRASDDWYLGAITNQEPRKFAIDLSFLDPNKSYLAEVYRDGIEAHWRDNPLDIEVELKSAQSPYTIDLAPGGGHAVRFRMVSN